MILDFGFLFQAHGEQTVSFLTSQPQRLVGAVMGAACIAGMFYKPRLAVSLFLLLLIPLILRGASGALPPPMVLLFLYTILYFYLAAVIGTFSYHQLKKPDQNTKKAD